MTIFSYSLLRLPKGVRVEDLADNFKLYSDEEIAWIKRRFTENGRHHYYKNADGMQLKLKYPVYILEGQCYAVYPGKKYLLGGGDNSFSRDKIAQNLETGEWLVDKTILVVASSHDVVREDVVNEQNHLLTNKQMVMSGADTPASFYRPFDADADNEDGKYDLFMPYVHGMDLQEWRDARPVMPLIMKMNMTFGLLHALEDVHARGVLHRDVKLRNAIYDSTKPAKESVRLVDFGLAISMDDLHDELLAGWGTPGYMAPEICATDEKMCGKYTEKSDIYALGVTIGQLWGLIDVDDAGVMAFNDGENFAGDFALKRCLLRILRKMTNENSNARLTLDELIFEVSKLRKLLPEEFCVVRTAYIDVNELLHAYAAGEQAWDHAIARLSCFDQVQLFTSMLDAEDIRKILSIRQALVNRGVIVAEQLYQGSREELAAYAHAVNNDDEPREDRMISEVKMMTLRAQVHEDHVVMREEHTEPDVETYSWSDWFGWMFGNLSQDAGAVARQVLQPMVGECSPGCFGLFGSFSRNSMKGAAPLDRIGYHSLSDSDDEMSNSSRPGSHY